MAAAHKNLARVFASRDETAAAIEELRLAIKLEVGDVAARNDLGGLLLKLGEVDAAILELEAALRIRPGVIEVRRNLEIARAQNFDQKRP